MKKIMTNIKTLAALLMASATFAACSSDDNTIDQQPAQPAGQQVYTMTVNAQKGGDAATTRALALDNKTLNATWATSENVFVKKGDTWATGSLQPQTDGTTATLKGTLSGVTIAKDDVLTLQFPRNGELDYTGQVGTLADIAAKYDYATATVTVASVSATGNINPTEATTTFQNQQAIVKFTLIDKADGLTPLSATQLVVNDGTTDYTINLTPATSEIYAAIPGFTGKTVTLTATVGSDTYTYEKANVTFTNGQYYEITVKMTEQAAVPTGALSGQFSVSGTKQVYFSKGNLQYDGTNWKFAASQWEVLGANGTGANGTATNYPMDLFTWGFMSNPAFNGYTYVEGTEDLKDGTDWGHVMGEGWYTLSNDEWNYLFNTRTDATSKYGYATVNGVHGIIILPDAFVDPNKNKGSNAFVGSTTDWNANVYTAENWALMEAAGAVFLPAAGYRDEASVKSVGNIGEYWSSSAFDEDSAFYVYFEYGLDANWSDDRLWGSSVRLVRQVE